MTFATLTAFAADKIVTVVTEYDVENLSTTNIEVKATVSGVAAGDEITYYVAKGDDIVYIDQKTAEGASVEFTFNAAQGDVLASSAKNGSDKGYTFPTFKFAEGVNFQTNGTATANEVQANWAKPVAEAGLVLEEGEAALTGGYVFQGKLSGQVEKEYGVQIILGENTYRFPAKGCDENGVYVVVIDGFDDTVPAVKSAIESATAYIAE